MAQDGSRLSGWKMWKNGTMIPDQHESGIQRGYMQGKSKIKHNPSSEHASRGNKSVQFYRVIPWGMELGMKKGKR